LSATFPSSLAALNRAASSPSVFSHSTDHCSTPTISFRINTYEIPRKCCIQRTYRIANSFICNTYKKHGGWGVLWLTKNPKKARALRPGEGHEAPLQQGTPIRRASATRDLSCLQRSNVPTFRPSDVPKSRRLALSQTEQSPPHPYAYNLCAILASLCPADRSVPPSWRSS
jgi:hypothetical protein